MLRPVSPRAGSGRDLSFWIGIAFIILALIGFSIVQFRHVLATLKPIGIPTCYCTWSGIAMNLSVVVLGIAVLAYLFSER